MGVIAELGQGVTLLEQGDRVVLTLNVVGVPGLYVPSDPGALDEKRRQGIMMISPGKLFEKVWGVSPGNGMW